MDERHWWIASKIQETFKIGGYDNPTLLEDFMIEETTLAKINKFLKAGGPCRLFFYCEKPETGIVSTRELHVTGTLASLKDTNLEHVNILYFLRNRVDKDVDGTRMERDIFCGELKHNTIETLTTLLSDVYIPLVKAQKDWGECNPDGQNQLMNNMDKFLTALNESTASLQSSKQMMLKQPDHIVLNDFKQQRAAALDPQLISQYEELVTEWMNTIEAVLTDTSDERKMDALFPERSRFMDPNAGPLSELERWRRRQRLLTNITEQLKGKECKAVIGVLITAKSRLLKKWKQIDAAITDGMNDTKDKVKFLESLKRHFDQLYSVDSTPSTIINTAIPGLCNSVKQMDSIARYYARTGFLGLMFTKVTNQLVMACKEYIKNCTLTMEDDDLLWDRIQDEIEIRDTSNTDVDPKIKLLKSQVESKLKPGATGRSKTKEGRDLGLHDDTLYGRLKACLTLQGFYRETLRSLRDSIGQSSNMSHFPSLSSVGGPGSFTTRKNGFLVRTKSSHIGSNRGLLSGTSRVTGSSPKKGVSSLLADVQGHGVPMTDEEAIMSHFDLFCNRIRQLIDVINTLAQYTKMTKSTRGVPKPRKEDLVIDDGSEQEEWRKYKKTDDAKPMPKIEFEEEDPDLAQVKVKMASPDRSLRVIAEDEEVIEEEDLESVKDEKKLDIYTAVEPGDEVFNVAENNQGLTEEELATLRKYYPEDEEDEGPAISTIIAEHLTNMTQSLSENVTTKTMLDVESKDKDRFDDHYSNFSKIVADVEKFLASYLHVIFCRKMKTQQGLDIITRLQAVQNRPGIRATLAEKFVETFNWYEADLEEVHQIYEQHKENPQLVRNAPPVAGAIHWSRQLLKRIEDPMKVFRDNKAITQLGDFGRIVRIYNRLATALVTFESLWFTQWKGRIDQARNGLRATLFVHHPVTNEIVVNADERVLELIHEAKWLTRLGIQVPESAAAIMAQEARFKNYKSHLELVLNDYKDVCNAIPEPLRNLFTPHTEYVNQQLQPGLNTLAWNSMNIDAFLHQIHSATTKLKNMQKQVNDVMENKVFKTLDTITNFYLFDHELAFSRAWPPEMFREEMLRSAEERSTMLQDYVETVMEGLQTVSNILAVKKAYSLVGMSMSNLSATAFVSKKKANSMESVKKCITPDPHGKGKRVSVIVDPEEIERERMKAQQEEQLVLDLIAYFRDHVYEAVLSATSRSLALLAESCGCDSEVVRVISAMSNQSSDASTPSPRNWGSRSGTPVQENEGRAPSAANSRPLSSLSQLSSMTWTTEKTHQVTFLQFEVEVKFSIPTITVEPTLDVAQTAVADVAKGVIESNRNIVWISERGEESFYDLINDDENVADMMSQLAIVVQDLDSVVNKHLFHFSYYNFLWKDDMHGNFKEFITSDPGIFAIKREVERYLYIEKKVLGIPRSLPVGPILLQTDPIKDALHGFSMAWKTQFASVLHEEAKKKLDQAVLYRSNVRNRLELHVQTLDQLNSALHLLEELRDMENKIDGIYLPIETMYSKLREFELRLPRQEVEEVDALRENWSELMDLAEQVREVLLKERRGAFEQELDKQVKTFVVEVIQFRNAFDAQGPAVPGIPPAEAVSRLQDFQQRYQLYDSKRKTLDSVSKLFGIPCKPFAELDKTGEELDLLSQLYGLFQKFIRFDTRFRDTLWAEVDLDASYKEVESYWDECLALPSKLKDWDAYNDLKSKLQTYLEVFPLLNSLAAKLRTGEETPSIREIRNRHWLQVMQVTGSSFQLEANVFRLCHLLDIGLIKHKAAIEEICLGASRELELEIKMRMTEEEWTEQVLAFEHYKRRGPIYLDKVFTERLLEQLEDAQALLANMLTSRYIGPLRDEAASWAEKLKEVAEVLELWLEVQDLWQYLEAVFSNQVAVRELPQEAKRFARIDKSWTKMMKRAFDTRNVLQCCYGGEVPKAVLLRHVYEELEICFKSLVGYLDNKRRVFPRFYYVSDPILLAILSRPTDLESVKPHLKSIFSSINDVKLEETRAGPMEPTDEVGFPGSAGGLRSTTPHSRAKTSSVLSNQNRGETPPKIDKRLTQVYKRKGSDSEKRKWSLSDSEKDPWSGIMNQYVNQISKVEPSRINMNPSALQQGPTYLPSEGIMEEIVIKDAVSVSSADGESFVLSEKVTLTDEVEIWLSKLRDSVCKTIREMNIGIIQDCNNGVAIDEWAAKYPAQVCRMGMLYHWTKECDLGIAEIKFDRKALQGALKKYISTVSKLPTVLVRGQWRNLEDPMLPIHKNRLECMITTSQFLRDALDQLCQRKLREVSDFEWRRSIRCYYQPIVDEVLPACSRDSNSNSPEMSEERYEPLIWILDTSYQYGNEFYGMNSGVALTPVTERCFLTMSQALQRYQGSAVTGPVGAGKTETVKGLANVLGQFLGVFQCSEQTDPTSLAKIIQGTAMDGCWCCFDESQALDRIAMAVMFEHLEAVTFALKARHAFATLTDGQEIPIKRSTAVHMTINLSDTTPISTQLANDIRLLFRPVSVIKPDMGMIMRAKSAALGFKAPVVLGSRLKVLSELAKDQLPAQIQHHFSVEALVGVLKKAMMKRKYIRDEKTQDKLDLKGKEETSRSNSQASDSRPVLPQQSSTVTQGNVKMAAGAHRKTGTPNPMTAAGKVEHAIVAQTIEEIMAPRLTGETMQIFKNIVKDTFAALPEPPPVIGAISARTRGFDIDQALEAKAKERGLIPHKPWLSKCNQLYNLSSIHHGLIVAGPPGSGKSTCIQTLIDALSSAPKASMSRVSSGSKGSSSSEKMHKLIRINPLVVDESDLMFGYLTPSNDWVDGIFTNACKKANRNLSKTWLCLDGPLNTGWADNFNSVLNSDKVLHLRNGDKLFLSDNINIIFETARLPEASPSTVARCGILYIDKDVVGWKPIAKAWLDSRTPQEIHEKDEAKFNTTHHDESVEAIDNAIREKTVEGVLQRAFQKTLDPVINFVLSDAKPRLKLSEVGMFKTCLGLLAAMLADNIEIGGELHIERLYLFCLIWTFGGLLDASDRKSFSDLLKTLSTALPDDDRDICVFDYYVDESGEWDPWISRVPEAVYADNQNMLGEVFVDTVDTIRTRILMDFASASGQNVLLVGPPGSGKTTLIDEFMDFQDSAESVCKRLVFSGASTAKQLQQFIEANIYHRQGFVYGAKENKMLKVFIDDVNLPVPDQFNVQRCNQLLRQLLDDKVLCTQQKPFEWKTVEGLNIISAMSMSEHPSVNNQMLSSRLLRHFAVFNLPGPQDEALKSIVHGILEANVTDNDKPGLEIDLHNNIVKASCQILQALQTVLRPTPLPGRYHYLFTLKDLTTCYQCLKRLPDESMADEVMVVSLWKHEMNRIIRDRISRSSDLNWFDEIMEKTVSQYWPKLDSPLHEHFVTFPTDARLYQRPVTSMGAKHFKIQLQPVETLRDLHSCLHMHLTRYNEEFGNVRLNIMLSDFVIAHIVRLHRVLSFHHGGNMLLVGAVGSHLTTLCQLALHVADVTTLKMDTSKQSNFFDGLRSAVRLTGSEGKILTLVFTARDLEDPVYLDAINSVLISGEYPHLFSNDELEGLLMAIGPSMKREFPSMSVDPMKFFIARVRCNLHMIICIQPGHQLLKIASRQYPGLLSGCNINYMCDWPQEALLGEASYFITKNQLTEEFEDLGEHMTTCLANIHSFVLRDCRQMPWAGDLNPEITLSSVKQHEKKKEQLKVTSSKVPNLPYSKVILHERIRLKHRGTEIAKNEVFVGPTTFRRFMDSFKYLYTVKSKERTQTVDQLKKVLATLDQTRNDAKVMKKAIKNTTGKFEDAKVRTEDLLEKLTHKATILEKLKAKVGLSTSLDAYLHLNEMEAEEVEEDELLKQEEYDDYDREFDKMREATLKTRGVQAREELTTAKTQLEECRKQLEYAREQVLHWKSKVDRNVIERLRGFTSPPVLVGMVMEMIMILIGKRLPSQRIEMKDYSGKDDNMSSRMSSSSSGTKIVKKSKKDETGRVDRVQWKATVNTMSDSTKFVDMLHNVSWEDGLPEDVLRAVESCLSQGKDGELGVTGEGSLLENAQDVNIHAKKRTPSPDNSKGITIAGAKYSSEDSATLVQYTIAIVEYTRRCGPLKAALERMNELQREIEENDRLQKEKEQEAAKILSKRLRFAKVKGMSALFRQPKPEEIQKEVEVVPEEVYEEEDLPRIQEEVNQLQAEFDQAVVEKHSLEMELISMNERLKAATEMVDSLKGQEEDWKQHVKDNDSNELLLANCISAAAFLTYCGPHNMDTRKRMGEFFMQVCEHHGMPLPKRCLFRNIQMVDFLYTQLDIMHLEILRLPTTPLMLENACFLMQGESITAWPLVCDPTSRIIEWLRFKMKDKGLVEVRYTEIRSQLENCLADGSPLLVTDCDIQKLAKDSRFRYAIQRCSDFINGKNRFKIIVEDHEVECDPRFRLYLHTTVEPHMVPQQLAAYASVMYFQLYRKDVEEELLNRFMAHEKSRLEDEQTALRQERQENMEFLDKLEKQMRTNLSSDVRLMNDLQATKKLAELKKQYDETVETQTRVEMSEGSILKARDGFRSIAQRAAVCFDVTQYMREVNPLYQISYNRYLDIYDAAISHSERSAIKAVLEKVTSSAYYYTARGLFERDRFIFALLLAIEVEDSLDRLGPGEREFLISPDYSSVVMLSLGHIQQSQENKIAQTKKPFDWMTDDQFHNLQVLATHFEWFQEMFDRMPKDGRETQWRNLCETDSPETTPLPDKMDEVYKPMQRLCVVRAVRSDKIMQASTVFINVVLGKNSLPAPAGRKGYYGDVGIDLPALLRQSSPMVPIMLMYTREAEVAVKMFNDFSYKKQNKTLQVSITDNNPNTERTARKYIQKGMAEGMWVLLHNAQNAPQLLLSLESILEEISASTPPDPQFRVWISCQAIPEVLPIRLIQNSVRTILDSPKVMKDSIVRSFSNFEPDILKQSTRAEWPLMLHNLCYLHAAIQLRTRFGFGGWNSPVDFHHIGNFEIQESLNFITSEFKDQIMYTAPDGTQQPRITSWTGIRYMLSEVIYGSYSTDVNDQQSLSAMVDYWVSPTAVKKDFEVARLKYRHPSAFFNPNIRLNSLIQALEGINYHFLDVPEACHIHPNVENHEISAMTLLGDDQYVFTRLNRVFDGMPSTDTLSHKLFPRPPSPFEGPALAGISAQSNNPSVVGQGVFATASFATFKMRKDVELWEICFTMLQKVPKAYNKDYIVEKVKKLGGFTTFNCYIMKELETMYRLLTEIKQTLTMIRNACETESLGDQVSETVLSAADDLYHLRIPRVWCKMSGPSAPPLTWGLGSWLNEMQSRCHHFEKILILGREKMPAYWLGAFFNPRGLLALIKQDYIKQYSSDRSGNFEQFVFQTEVTSRDKDHLRDPPQEGMFVYGIYIWGCAWEKTTGELQDAPPRSGYATLPVVHLTCWPANEKPILQDSNRAAETYQCPVYASRIATRDPIMELDVRREGIPSARWSLRGLSATIRPY
ncbi:dynein axonemal heavy chain 5-like isoform X6 [Mercenaria mercenaria]|uniref:dynein axonemal heavy chain 5-like isoform X6 n=1 Tax=Mercenaria mercenaria TaxID=6596 RepID=UPI00234F373D|nr:dynein axonemal heavy chain 5-like isoform X6 [Mercenaria mercenaria]